MARREKHRLDDQPTFLTKGGYSMLCIVMRRFCWGVILALPFLAGGVMAKGPMGTQTNGVSVTFNADIYPDPCGVDIGSGGDSHMDGSTLDFGSLPAAKFKNPGDILDPQTFVLKLTDCGDPSVLGVQPNITVVGNTINGTSTVFRDPGSDDSPSSTSKGLGFVFAVGDQQEIEQEDNWLINNIPTILSDDIEVASGVSIPMTVAITRKGSEGIQPGSLVAKVRFIFTYP
ncbi:fimbrial protein [Photorhabdus khanii]|uniref:Fimbrial protein n=1 Tax=Photorhabdus khanii subsp. guanajuatensis TaxID=2100166 RepID=A0A4R4J738_9GAMM|nr:fimbrial protein [Photorhabdus khanii]TDB49286.1 hypothetical protein C5467_17665 [Photorhabdus khanii subsp. guanajuatensis]